jgi:hypothetical protein
LIRAAIAALIRGAGPGAIAPAATDGGKRWLGNTAEDDSQD